MDTIDVLIAARAEIEKGWAQKWAVSPTGNVCMLGAIDVSLGVTRAAPRSLSTIACDRFDVVEALGAAGPGVLALVAFNDAPSTTKTDVLALFDRAIAAEAQKVAGNPDPSHVHLQAA